MKKRIKKSFTIKEDKEDTEDCSKIGETVSNEEDSERTITEEESLTEHKNEDSDDEVIDINKNLIYINIIIKKMYLYNSVDSCVFF